MVGQPKRTRSTVDVGIHMSPEDAHDLKEVKVKLPVDQVMRLHYTRMKRRKNFSEIVNSALTRYFDEFLEP